MRVVETRKVSQSWERVQWAGSVVLEQGSGAPFLGPGTTPSPGRTPGWEVHGAWLAGPAKASWEATGHARPQSLSQQNSQW